jgi:alanine dehydrogenase
LPETLILTRKEVEQVLTIEDVIPAVEDVFKAFAKKKARTPPILHWTVEQPRGSFAAKCGVADEWGLSALKFSCGFPENPSKHGIPTTLGTIVLSSHQNGAPLAIMDGSYITAVRTGAAGAVAAKYLARGNSRSVGIVGTGVQGRMQALALSKVIKYEKILAYDKVAESKEKYALEMSAKLGIPVKEVESVEDAVKGVDILVTATPSAQPYVKAEWIGNGTHITSIGSDRHGKQELQEAVYKKAKLVTDWREPALEKGLFSSEDIYAEIGEIIAGTKKGRENDQEITIFDSSGIGLQDLAAAKVAYEKAKNKGLGTSMQLL